MWIVTGKTASGQEASYKIPASKDTDRGHIVGLAYAEHAKGHATDPLDYPSVETQWTADNVKNIVDAITISERSNFSVERRIAKGVWERYSVRALRTIESAREALEGAASFDTEGKYRIVETHEVKYVVAVSKNAFNMANEEPDKPVQEEIKVDAVHRADLGLDATPTPATPAPAPAKATPTPAKATPAPTKVKPAPKAA